MAYTVFENNVTPINDTNLNAMQRGLMELVFPVGSTYITQTDTNPNTILGFGTWQRFKGLVSLGLDENDDTLNTIGNTGGEKKHLLTTNEMPSHQHIINYDARQDASSFANSNSLGFVLGGTVREENIKTTLVGGSQSHNNMQPYEVVGYMWIRRN